MKEDELFKTLLHRTVNDMYISATKGKYIEKPARDELWQKISIGLIGLFVFAGGEIIKVIFRKNFGKEGINLLQIIVGFVGLLSISALTGFLFFNFSSDTALFGSKFSFLFTAIIYLSFAIFILIKGINDNEKAEDFSDNQQGESYLLKIKGWSQNKIQNLAEPSVALLSGLLLMLLNITCGAPLVFCALSYWLHLGYWQIFKEPRTRDPKRDKRPSNGLQRQFARPNF